MTRIVLKHSPDLVTKFPVYDLENNLLVEAGTELTTDFLKELAAKSKVAFPKKPLLSYGSIKTDLMKQFSIMPYKMIFSQQERVDAILAVMNKVVLPVPILQGMDYFRKYDFHTYRHMLMIFALSTLIAEELGADHKDYIHYKMAHSGPTHDFGKISVPIKVLLKKEALTSEEFQLLRHHPTSGCVLLTYYMQETNNLASIIARDHHERLNGSGYPRGIIQKDPMVEITTVSDIYDALIAQRPYRPVSYDNRSALEELTWMAQRGEIGWNAVHVLVSHNRKDKPSYKDFQISMECRGKEPEGNVYGKIAPNSNDDKELSKKLPTTPPTLPTDNLN